MEIIGVREHCTTRNQPGHHKSGFHRDPMTANCCHGPVAPVEDHTDHPVIEGEMVYVLETDPDSPEYGYPKRMRWQDAVEAGHPTVKAIRTLAERHGITLPDDQSPSPISPVAPQNAPIGAPNAGIGA